MPSRARRRPEARPTSPLRKSIAQVDCASQVRVDWAAVARPSPVSDQVRSLFGAEQKHLWSIDEPHEAVVQSLGAADYSTVFRAVSGMEKDGAIKRIDLGDGKVHYELSEEHHEHIRCDSCGRVVEVPGCVLEDAERSVKSSTGFVVTSHQLLFTGVCPDCARGAGPRQAAANPPARCAEARPTPQQRPERSGP